MSKFKYRVEGKVVQSDTALSEKDIEEIAHSMRTSEFQKPADLFSRGLDEGLDSTILGVKQFAASLSNALGLEDDKNALELTDQINKNRAKYQMTPAADSLYGKVGKVAGETLPFMAVPASSAGMLGNVAIMGGKSALIEATRPTTESDFFNKERGINAAVGGTVGAAVEAVTEVGRLGYSLFRGALRTPKGEIKTKVGKEDINREVVDIADKFGIRVTPFEATQRPELAQFENQLVPDDSDVRELSNAFLKDSRTLARKNEEFITSVFENSPEQAAVITRGFSSLKNTKDKGAIQDYIQKDPFLSHHFKAFKSNKEEAARLSREGISEDSLAYLNEFRQNIRDKAGSSQYVTKQGALETSSKAGRKLTQASNEIRDVISTMSPEFAQANTLVRYQKNRQLLEATLDSSPTRTVNLNGTEQEIVDPSVLYNKHFASEKQFQDMKRSLDGNEEAIKKLTEVRTILRALKDSPLRNNIFKGRDINIAPEGGGVLGAGAAVTLSMLSVLDRKKQANLIKYITNDNWQSGLLDSVDPTMLKKAGYAALQKLDQALVFSSAKVATQEEQPQQ